MHMPRTIRTTVALAVLAVFGLGFFSVARLWADRRPSSDEVAASITTGLIDEEAAQLVTAGTDGVVLPGSRGDLVLQIHNDETTDIRLMGLNQAGTAHVAHRDDCASMAEYLTVLPTQGLVLTVPAGTTRSLHVTGAVYLSRQAGVECAGAAFSVPVVVTYHH
jgi:hypothetical protein